MFKGFFYNFKFNLNQLKFIMHREPKLERFNESVLSKYQVYNSIFLTLPFDDISKTGSLLHNKF